MVTSLPLPNELNFKLTSICIPYTRSSDVEYGIEHGLTTEARLFSLLRVLEILISYCLVSSCLPQSSDNYPLHSYLLRLRYCTVYLSLVQTLPQALAHQCGVRVMPYHETPLPSTAEAEAEDT